MAANTTPAFPAILAATPGVTFVNADGTAYKSVVTGNSGGNAAGTLIERVSVVYDDTAALVLKVAIQSGGTDYQIGEVNIPLGTGTNGTARSLNLFALLATVPDISNVVRPDGSLVLAPAEILRVAAKTAVPATKTLTLKPQGVWNY